jgi:dTMP kinase
MNSSYTLSPKATQFMFAVNCFIHKEEVVDKVDPNEYDIILSDRGYLDFFAYGLEFVDHNQTWLDFVFEFLGENKKPDLTLFYDVDPEIAKTRKIKRQAEKFSNNGEDKIEAQGLELQHRVRDNFLSLLKLKEPDHIIIDVNEKSIDQVFENTIGNKHFINWIFDHDFDI